jgi:spore maturation protein CgeB
MTKSLGILYVGSLNPNSNSNRRFKTLELLGHKARGINIDKLIYGNIFSRIHYHFNVGPGIKKLNRQVLAAISESIPDLLLIDNKPFITASTLKKVKKLAPGIKIINLITDDPTGRYRYAWRLCLKTTALYDCHFVQRKVNVGELKAAGARRVELCYRSFDPSFHKPVKLSDEEKKYYSASVGFIGTYEDSREEYIAYLIQNNIPVSITGDGWPKGKYWELIKPFYRGPSIYGDPYIKTLNGMQIALHFLRHANRDEQDSRTFEIPACRVFMLAESSELHLSLFRNGEEAVFFESKEELLKQVRYYMQHEEERSAIAARGYERSVQSGYDHTSRLSQVIETVFGA